MFDHSYIPKDHPRYESLKTREKMTTGMSDHVVAPAGLIAHGRGEAFDYLIGEKSGAFADEAVHAAACAFLIAEHPVISVNGNIAALCPEDLVRLSGETGALLEVNLFYRSAVREKAIMKVLKNAGAKHVLGIGKNASAVLPEVGSARRRVDPEGILKADMVFVPLEDGDRTEGLVNMGKRVITVDLNPLSRTACKATVTIVDNILRAMPALIAKIKELKNRDKAWLTSEFASFSNTAVMRKCIGHISKRLTETGRHLYEE